MRCDAFVVERDVRYPEDHKLFYDRARNLILQISWHGRKWYLPGWRQGDYPLKKVQKLFYAICAFNRRIFIPIESTPI